MNINQILAKPCNKGCSKYGADMGRRNLKEGKPEKLHLQYVTFIDGCYDRGGAYWGGPADLWCAFSPDDTENDPGVRVFVRAPDRETAKMEVLKQLPGAG